ncbi:unnamed protein product [Urochloa humidicola]
MKGFTANRYQCSGISLCLSSPPFCLESASISIGRRGKRVETLIGKGVVMRIELRMWGGSRCVLERGEVGD